MWSRSTSVATILVALSYVSQNLAFSFVHKKNSHNTFSPKVQSFSKWKKPCTVSINDTCQYTLNAAKDNELPEIDSTRREHFSTLIKGTFSSLSLSSISFDNPAIAAVTNRKEVGTSDHPIVIIGGGGRTGMEVAKALGNEGFGQMDCVTMTRTGNNPFQIIKLAPTTQARIRSYNTKVDVRDPNSLSHAFDEVKPSVVVYAASASKQGGNSFDVDDAGVENVAKACHSINADFILISALAVDRPESKSFQITNTIGGYMDKIMDAKLNGEEKTKKIMGKNGYVIIRPGVLVNGKTKEGVNGVELNQGDTIGGGISREELAGVVVGAIQNGKRGITVEAYRKSTATKLQPNFVVPSGNELTASTYKALFDNAKED